VAGGASRGAKEELLAGVTVSGWFGIECRHIQGAHPGREGLKLIRRKVKRGHTAGSAVADQVRNLALAAAAQIAIIGEGGGAVSACPAFPVATGAQLLELRFGASDVSGSGRLRKHGYGRKNGEQDN
jgi:hypothetical protein